MAKTKRKSTAARRSSKILFDEALPQNIVEIGQTDKDITKRIYISQQAYRTIRLFTKNKTTNESGGILVGQVIEEFGKTNILIRGFIEAKYTESTPTTLTFTHETWEYVHSELERKYENAKIVGWIHTHPNFGIFLSEYDMFIHGNFFSDENQVAYVVDPIQHQEGFYYWKNKQIEKNEGFYIFDNPGTEIKIANSGFDEDTYASGSSGSGAGRIVTYIIIALLTVAVAALALISVNSLNRISILEAQQESSKASTEQRISALGADVSTQQAQISSLGWQVNNLNIAVTGLADQILLYHPEEAEDTADPDTETQPAEQDEAEKSGDSQNSTAPAGTQSPDDGQEPLPAGTQSPDDGQEPLSTDAPISK